MRGQLIGAMALAWLLLALPGWASAEPASDEYIAGYAAAVLRHEFGLSDTSLQVRDGVVSVNARSLGGIDREKVTAALASISGVTEVIIRENGEPPAAPPSQTAVQVKLPEAQPHFLPRGLLFSPLHADPRWPHFSGAYRSYSSGDLSRTFAGNFGETFAIYRNKAGANGEWEFGIQAGLFSLFDLTKKSIDLVNADYNVGFLASYRSGRFSGFVRLHHQSSHLGDEYILSRPSVTRVNLSFEEFDAKLSYELWSWARVYGGAGYLVHREPPDVKPGTTQWGIEFMSPVTYLGGSIRPVAYADFQANERSDWAIGRSILVGVQFENARIGDRQIQLLGEYFAGPSPNGQFYTERREWFGIGIHFYF